MIYHGKGGLEDLSVTVNWAADKLKQHRDRFDSIAVSGMSGVIVGAPVSHLLDIPLVIVRKRNDDSHSGERTINARALGERFIFLDDFISMGGTLRRVVAELQDDIYSNMKLWNFPPGKYVGYYLYRNDVLHWEEDGSADGETTQNPAPAPVIDWTFLDRMLKAASPPMVNLTAA